MGNVSQVVSRNVSLMKYRVSLVKRVGEERVKPNEGNFLSYSRIPCDPDDCFEGGMVCAR